jgi:hypothetical protein
MNYLQKFRQKMAEDGYEKTIAEVSVLFQCGVERLMSSLTLEDYLRYKNMNKDDIVAISFNQSYEEAKDTIDLLIYVGNLKFNF